MKYYFAAVFAVAAIYLFVFRDDPHIARFLATVMPAAANPKAELEKAIVGLDGKSETVTIGDSPQTLEFSGIRYDVRKSESLVHPFEATIQGSAREEVRDKAYGYDFKAQLGYVAQKWEVLGVETTMVPLDEVRDDTTLSESKRAIVNAVLTIKEVAAPNLVKTALAQTLAVK